MTGRIAALVIIVAALLVGGTVYYAQVYGYYRVLEPQDHYTVATPDGPAQIAITDFSGIDSDSSPLRYRACFLIDGPLPALIDRPGPEPLIAPNWFDCFDAGLIGADLTSGAARAVLVEANHPWGFDHVMALYPDGRAYVWPQLNTCGEHVFDGRPAPADCPPPPAPAH